MKKKQTNHMNKIHFFVFWAFISLSIFPVPDISAKDNDLHKSINLTPISQNRSISTKAVTSSQSPDPRATLIEKRLKERLNDLNTKKTHFNNAQNVPKSRQASNAEELRRRLTKEVNIWLRPVAGTPRQIKVKKKAKQNGAVLERAIKDNSSEKQRDTKTARDFLRSKRGLLRILNPDDELSLSRYTKDPLNRRHFRYHQTFKGLPVWPAELNVHLDPNGNVDLMNGAFVPTPRRMVTRPAWNADDAISASRKVIPGAESAKTNTPVLIIYAPGDQEPRLAWKIELSLSLESNWLVIIDALNGSTLMSYNQVLTKNVSGSGTDLFGKTQQLNLWQENGKYFMVDTSKDMYDETSDPPGIDTTRGAIIIRDMENTDLPTYGGKINASNVTSSSAFSGWLPDGVSLAYCVSETYDYYLDRHNRDSIDNNGSSIIGFVRVCENYDNAFWSGEYNAMFFGDAKPYAGALDVVAHELTHGITSFTCALIYRNQSGALNEAFSDIFGEMVEARTTGRTDWINGTLLDDNGRNLKDPSSVEIFGGYYYPSKMSEFYGQNHPLLNLLDDQDYGGVHINMTIPTHCFYLLAEGLDNAIGLRDAEQIFYRAQTIHLVQNSQFIDARLACISSAEELFGDNSVQVEKVKEAFDAVEIFDNVATPEPTPTQPVGGDDASIFIYYDPYYARYFMARYEKELGDSIAGTSLSCYDIARSRPSVTGDGSLSFFVDSINDACFLDTDSSGCEDCLGMPGEISSVAMSPDGNVYGFVLLDDFGEATNSISVIDLSPGGQPKTYPLESPATDGESLDTVLYADAMDFTSDNRYLIYDAYNILEFKDGTKLGAWSIYAIDLLNDQTISLVGPYSDLDVGFPALSQTNNHLMTFDAVDSNTGETTIMAYNFLNGDSDYIGTVSGYGSVPGYTGDDSAIVYSMPDPSTWTGYSLMMQNISENGITPVGSPTLYISDAEYGVMYRRGTFTPPKPEISVSPPALSFDTVDVGNRQTRSITISNTGTGDLIIDQVILSESNSSHYNIIGGCAGQTLPPEGICQFKVNFAPTSAGRTNATLSVHSNDPDMPELSVMITGTGILTEQPPTTPTGLAVNAVSLRKILLRWTDKSDNEDGFVIERKKNGCNSSDDWSQIAMVSEDINTYDDMGFDPNTQFSYRVGAFNNQGYSDYSNCGTTVSGIAGTPSAPVNLVATYSSANSLVLTWDEWSSKVTRFEIYRDVNNSGSWTLIATTASDELTYTDNTATNNQTIFYSYKVQACNDTGCSPPAYKVGMPAQPTGLSASINAQGKVALSWTDNSDYERGFEIYRKTGSCSSSGSWEKIKQAGINRKTVTGGSAVSGTTYSYKIRAYYRSWGIPYVYGYSDWSDCVSITAQ